MPSAKCKSVVSAFGPWTCKSKTSHVTTVIFCSKHVQGSTAETRTSCFRDVGPWTCLMQKFKLATLNVLLYTRSGAKWTYDTLAFSWRCGTGKRNRAGALVLGNGRTGGPVKLDSMWQHQGSLKGESVVAAILSSRMEQSYCTSGFFRFQARSLTSSAPILTITHYLRVCFLIRTSRGNINVPKTCKRRTFSKIKNVRFLQDYDDYNCIFGIKSKGLSLYSEIKMCWLKNSQKKNKNKNKNKNKKKTICLFENIHNFDTYFHPLRNIVLKLFDDKIM